LPPSIFISSIKFDRQLRDGLRQEGYARSNSGKRKRRFRRNHDTGFTLAGTDAAQHRLPKTGP
ncbi:hypothetical protein, partial [Klebsiella pneumoniae]|uniref:hypothetical protein n=1 Tax=Klebsiella pneumoniae TaxID=573 RepID=UPI00196833D5